MIHLGTYHLIEVVATSFCKVPKVNMDEKLKKSSRKEGKEGKQMSLVPTLIWAIRRNPTSFHG
jgi:hypothetical protein